MLGKILFLIILLPSGLHAKQTRGLANLENSLPKAKPLRLHTEEGLRLAISKLKSLEITEDFFNTPMRTTVCPYMEELTDHKLQGHERPELETLRRSLLTEVLKIYAQVNRHERHHHNISCLYNYYRQAWNEELDELSQYAFQENQSQILTDIKSRMRLFHEESLEGNGDYPFPSLKPQQEAQALPSPKKKR